MPKGMNQKQKNRLQELLEFSGLSDKEVSVYTTLVELGKGTVTEVARNSKVGRTHCYIVLNQLAGRGLVVPSGKEPKQEFSAESPEKLKHYLSIQLEKQKEVFEEISKSIPELTSVYKKGDRPRVRFYEGIEGLETVYEDTLSAKENIIRGILTFDELHKTLPKYFPEYYKRRAKRNLLGKAIVADTPLGRSREVLNDKEFRETIFVPKELFGISPEIDIYDNKVMIASWREKLGIIIESAEIADAMKKIFELAWIGAKHVEKDGK